MAKDMRERIMEEVLREINFRGADFHMDDLAHSLRISKRTLYEHFSSKQDVIKESVLSLVHKLYHAHLQMINNEALTPEEKIIQFFHVPVAGISVLSVRKMNDILVKMPELYDVFREAQQKDWDLLSDVLDEALQDEGFKPFDKILLMHMLQSATNEIIEYFDEVKHDYSFSEYMEKCIRVILYGIKNDRRK